jgi:predicted metalloprotease with PDZ domain
VAARTLAAVAAATLVAACGSAPPRAAPNAPPAAVDDAIRYEVTVEAAARELVVHATLPAGVRALVAADGVERFVRDVVDGSGRPIERTEGRWPVACARGCAVRYRFLLRAAGDAFDDPDVATTEGDAVEAPPSSWLLRPAAAGGATRCILHVTTSPPLRFVTGVRAVPGRDDTYATTLDDLESSPYSAFGVFRTRTIEAAGARITLAVGRGRMRAGDDVLARWVATEARAVGAYYGRFPVDGLLVLVVPGRSGWVGLGKTLAGGGASIMVRVGEDATPATLDADWVLAHEMVHLAFPSVAREELWIEEGLATYVEAIVRARAGLVDAREVWRGFVEGMPNGQPGPGDKGLDHTPTWGRVYWGGALFCLVADVAIRKATGNARSLDDALRAIVAAGGDNAHRWPLARAFELGDAATGTRVLRDLHARWGSAPVTVDLAALFRELGVAVRGGDLAFDDGAPSAAIRRAITAPTSTAAQPR